MSFMLSFIPSQAQSSSFYLFSLLYVHIMMQVHTILSVLNEFFPHDDVPLEARTTIQEIQLQCRGPHEIVVVESR